MKKFNKSEIIKLKSENKQKSNQAFSNSNTVISGAIPTLPG